MLNLAQRFNQAQHTFSASPGGIFPPETLPEVAVIGRSNVGKSSLINALVGRTKLARTSHTPGATRALHFYTVPETLVLVDLPGYGYALRSKVESEEISAWVQSYLGQRRSLKKVCVLVDARHGLKDSDYEMLKTLAHFGVPAMVVLTKADKLKKTELATQEAKLTEDLLGLPGTQEGFVTTSSEKGLGIERLREEIVRL